MGLAGHCNARTEHIRRIPHFHHDDIQLHSWQLHQQVELEKVFSKISWRAHEGFIRQWSCMSSSELRMWWHTASLQINIPLSIFVASNSRLASRSSYSELLMTNGDLYWELRSCHGVWSYIRNRYWQIHMVFNIYHLWYPSFTWGSFLLLSF